MLRKKWIGNLLICISFLVVMPVQSQDVVVTKIEGKNQLVKEILNLIFSKSDPQSKLKELSEELPETRLIEAIQQNKVDLMWAGASPNLDQTLQAVRIPIYKGLLGHRIFIIKKADQHLFDDIKTLDQLKQLKAGQGTLWGDTKVLQAANIPVETTIDYPNLFYMLEGGRFDYFPRAIQEPWDEVNWHPELNLVVEKNILLIYPYAMYFYVNKNNHELYDKLVKGFEMAIADGSFDELFLNSPMTKKALQNSNLKNRTVIRINNPNMHPDTPIDRPELWLDVSNL